MVLGAPCAMRNSTTLLPELRVASSASGKKKYIFGPTCVFPKKSSSLSCQFAQEFFGNKLINCVCKYDIVER